MHGRDRYVEPCVVTPEVCAELPCFSMLDPTHLALELDLIEALAHERPGRFQVACFDTAFHRTLRRVAQMLTLPRRLFDAAVRRYGFHGLSFTSGVGENSAPIRERICGGLEILRVRIDPSRNSACAAVISPAGAPVTVRVIRTDEERVIAVAVVRLLKTRSRSEQQT